MRYTQLRVKATEREEVKVVTTKYTAVYSEDNGAYFLRFEVDEEAGETIPSALDIAGRCLSYPIQYLHVYTDFIFEGWPALAYENEMTW